MPLSRKLLCNHMNSVVRTADVTNKIIIFCKCNYWTCFGCSYLRNTTVMCCRYILFWLVAIVVEMFQPIGGIRHCKTSWLSPPNHKLEYASPLWIALTDASKLKSIHWRIAAPCFNLFFPRSYSLQLCLRSWVLKVMCCTSKKVSSCSSCCSHVFLGSKFCPSVINHSSLRVPFFNIRNFCPIFFSTQKLPSARCAATANLVAVIQIYLVSKLYLWIRFYTRRKAHLSYGFNSWANLCLSFGT